ncbi:MAG: tRNA (adenosine(37)-N6)-dimethylallyltransferase MiaA [Bifidobacteriaceae bacterium]|nr:tRNA (adenosine(37)-N6)-dimethylallyltransferase MiaA [Bifidobacteriaceae bacterium]
MVGPTAVGKSALALDLAQRLGAEVVNADSMALYRGMAIGTARTPADQRRGIAHHQFEVLGVHQEASVAAYQRHARADIEAVWARGRTALLVGGSGLYARAVTDQIDFPPTDPAVRAKWERLGRELGGPHLRAELAALDPAAAQNILPGNIRRLARALEAIELTGRPFAARLPAYTPWRPLGIVGLELALDQLDQRIAARAAWMLQAGLVQEARRLVGQGLLEGRTARRAIGYPEALALLAGELTPAEAEARIATATRQLARRQLRWFRRDPRITWLDAAAPDLLDQALAAFQRAGP